MPIFAPTSKKISTFEFNNIFLNIALVPFSRFLEFVIIPKSLISLTLTFVSYMFVLKSGSNLCWIHRKIASLRSLHKGWNLFLISFSMRVEGLLMLILLSLMKKANLFRSYDSDSRHHFFYFCDCFTRLFYFLLKVGSSLASTSLCFFFCILPPCAPSFLVARLMKFLYRIDVINSSRRPNASEIRHCPHIFVISGGVSRCLPVMSFFCGSTV